MGLLRPCLALQNNPFLGQVYLFHFKPHNSFYLQGNLCHIQLWPQILPTMTFKPHFWTITILSLIFITFRVSHFPVSHLTYKTVKLGLQNTLNMSKTTRVYFGVLHIPRAENSRADALAKLATASQEDLSRLTPVEHLAEPSIDLYYEEVAPIMS